MVLDGNSYEISQRVGSPDHFLMPKHKLTDRSRKEILRPYKEQTVRAEYLIIKDVQPTGMSRYIQGTGT